MIAKLGLALAVAGLAIASAVNNFNYASQAGQIGAAVAISADAYKLFAPHSITALVNQSKFIAAGAATLIWFTAILFSLTAAVSQSAHQRKGFETRQQVIIKPINQLPTLQLALAKIESITGITSNGNVCGWNGQTIRPNGKTTRKHCPKWLTLKRQINQTNQEVKQLKKEANQSSTTLTGNTVEAQAIKQIAQLANFDISKTAATLFMVYLWVAMIELGSALGGFSLSSNKKD